MPRIRFADFMDVNEQITAADLAERAGVDESFIGGLHNDSVDPTRPEMISIARAASAILGRKVRVTELFDLGDGER